MKRCPTCKRAYHDDTLVFCLEDGARLSAAYDPHAALPPLEPPITEILPPGRISSNQAPPDPRATIKAVVPAAYAPETPKNAVPEKHGGKLWMILGGIVALLVVGLISMLTYLAFKTNNRSIGETPVSTSNETPVSNANAQTKTFVPVNANQNSESKLSDDNPGLNWLDGVWTGEGYQTDTKTTWKVTLTVKDDTYTVEYPNIPCRGRWNLNDQNSRGASFTEAITQGVDRCANNSRILIEKVNDSEISCKYSHAGGRAVIATAVLSKKL